MLYNYNYNYIYIHIGLNYIVDQTKCNSLPIKMLDS